MVEVQVKASVVTVEPARDPVLAPGVATGEQRVLENLEAIAGRSEWGERLARIKTRELLSMGRLRR